MNERTERKTKEEKLAILNEATELGVTATCQKYGIYPATYYNWKTKYESMGEEGFTHGMTPDQLKEIRRLRKENQRLKDLLIEKELESKLKDELLKKSIRHSKEGVSWYLLCIGIENRRSTFNYGYDPPPILLQAPTRQTRQEAIYNNSFA
jgi:putative transposase